MRVRAMATAVMRLARQPDCYGFGPLFIGGCLRIFFNSGVAEFASRWAKLAPQVMSPRVLGQLSNLQEVCGPVLRGKACKRAMIIMACL